MIRRVLRKRPSGRTVAVTFIAALILAFLGYRQYRRGVFDFFLRPGLESQPRFVLQKNAEKPLQIIDVEKGEGQEAVSGARLAVHYTGSFEDGTPFDSSYTRKAPFEFNLGAGEVISGWELGLLGMREGGRRRLIVPPRLGYGAAGVPGVIPPDTTLVFDITLVKVLGVSR